jgi:hypothetical protein
MEIGILQLEPSPDLHSRGVFMNKLALLKTCSTILATLATVAVIGCGKSNNNNNSSQPAGTVVPTGVPPAVNPGTVVLPTANTCFRALPMASRSWDNYRRWGFRRYGAGTYTWGGYGGYVRARIGYQTPFSWPRGYVETLNNNHGFCGCPAGTQPVCDTAAGGIMCLQIAPQNYAIATWAWRGNQFQFNDYVGYNNGYYGTGPYYDPYNHQDQCFQNVGQTCQVGFNNTCGAGVCVPVNAGSSIGLCARAW